MKKEAEATPWMTEDTAKTACLYMRTLRLSGGCWDKFTHKQYSFVYDVDDEMGASRGREKHPCFYDASGGF